MVRSKSGRTVVWVLFLLYRGIMLCMLFGRSTHDSGEDYLHSVLNNINIVPMNTTIGLIRGVFAPSDFVQFKHDYINLLGNVIVFVPLGIFLPVISVSQRRCGVFFATTSTIILAVEFLQLFTLRGICDIDDYLLNMIGLFAGFALFRLCRLYR